MTISSVVNESERVIERYQGSDVISSKDDVTNGKTEEEISMTYVKTSIALLSSGASNAISTSTVTVTIATSFKFVPIAITSKVFFILFYFQTKLLLKYILNTDGITEHCCREWIQLQFAAMRSNWLRHL